MSFADTRPIPSAPPGTGGTKPRSWDVLPVDPAVASVLQFMPDRNIAGVHLDAGLYWHDLSNFVRGFVSQYAMTNSYAADPSAFEVGMSAFISDDDTTWRLAKKSVPPLATDWVEINEGMQIKLWVPDKAWKRGDVALVPWLPEFYRTQNLDFFRLGNVMHANAQTYSVWVAIDDIAATTPAEVGHGTTWLACNVPPGMYVTEGPISHKTVSWARVGHSTNTYFLDSFSAGVVFAMVSSPEIFAAGDMVVVVRTDDPGGENNINWIGKIFKFNGEPIHGAPAVGAPSIDTNTRFSSGWQHVASVATPIATATVPIGPNANGTAGDIAFDADHLYLCVAMDTWIRFNAGHGGGW